MRQGMSAATVNDIIDVSRPGFLKRAAQIVAARREARQKFLASLSPIQSLLPVLWSPFYRAQAHNAVDNRDAVDREIKRENAWEAELDRAESRAAYLAHEAAALEDRVRRLRGPLQRAAFLVREDMKGSRRLNPEEVVELFQCIKAVSDGLTNAIGTLND